MNFNPLKKNKRGRSLNKDTETAWLQSKDSGDTHRAKLHHRDTQIYTIETKFLTFFLRSCDRVS